MEVVKNEFGTIHDQTVWQYTLTNDHGLQLKVMNYGATLNRIDIPDRTGKSANVVLGYDRFEDYLKQNSYFGATVGRVAGRIAAGRFTIDDHDYQLPLNNGKNTNHGGPDSFERQLWEGHIFHDDDCVDVLFELFSPDGTNGFPGNLHASVRYSLNNENEWQLHYEASTDKATLYNPTNHVYFNLTGELSRTVDNHILTVNSRRFGEIKKDGLPTGNLINVTGTPFDFTNGAPLSRGFQSDHPQNGLVNGYDHPFFLENGSKAPAAILEDQESGRRITMTTTNNAVVVYTANGLADQPVMYGHTLRPHSGVTLEAQMMPDAIHHDGFGNTILRPGDTYRADTVYRFDWSHA